MATERGGEEEPTRRTPQQQPPKGREHDWKKSSEGLQGCRAELLLELRPQTSNTRSRRRPDRLLQASKDDEFEREARPQFGVRQRRERCTPEGRWTHPRTMGPVVPHSPQRQVTEARPEHRRRPWPVAREHAIRSSAHDVEADRRHPLVGERKGYRTGRSLRWAVQDHPQRWSRPARETARYRRLYLEGGGGFRSSGNMPSS